jgi:hypothetical protein
MPRPRKPTRTLELTGAFRKHPERRQERENEPQIDEPLGDPPDCLNEAERARWLDIAGMYPWLNFSHRLIVEQAARLWALERSGKAKTGDSKLLQTAIRILGGTPSDSSKVKMPPKPADTNPYAELA